MNASTEETPNRQMTTEERFEKSKKRLAKLLRLTATWRNIPVLAQKSSKTLSEISRRIKDIFDSFDLCSLHNEKFTKKQFIINTLALNDDIYILQDPDDLDQVHALWLFVICSLTKDNHFDRLDRELLGASREVLWNTMDLSDIWRNTIMDKYKQVEKSVFMTLDLMKWRQKKMRIVKNESGDNEVYLDTWYIGKTVGSQVTSFWDFNAPPPYHKHIIYLTHQILDHLKFLASILYAAEHYDVASWDNIEIQSSFAQDFENIIAKQPWLDHILTKPWLGIIQTSNDYKTFVALGFKTINEFISANHLQMAESPCEVDALQFLTLSYNMYESGGMFSCIRWSCYGLAWYSETLTELWNNIDRKQPFYMFARTATVFLFKAIQQQLQTRETRHFVACRHNDQIYKISFVGLTFALMSCKSISEVVGIRAKEIVFSPDLQSPKLEESTSDCVFCLEKPSTWIFNPCGHLCLCRTCSRKFNKKKMAQLCPICRKRGKAEPERLYEGDVIYRC